MKREKQILLYLTAEELKEIDDMLQKVRNERKDVTYSRSELVRELIKQSITVQGK